LIVAKTNTPASRQPAPGPPAQGQARQNDANFPALLMKSQAEFAKVIRSPEMVERFMRVALTEFRSRPELARCSPHSIMASVMIAAQLNFEVGGPMKQCYLIPYGEECKLEVSYIGYLELSRRSRQFRDIDACLVCANDVFDYHREPRPILYHKPNLWDPGKELGAYVYAVLQNGEPKFLAMNHAEIEKVRRCSKFPNGAPWTTWWGEKAKCSVLRRFLKTQKLTPELALAIENDQTEFIMDDRGPARVDARIPIRRGVAGLRQQLELDEPALPPSPSRVYSEADDVAPDPGDASEEPGVEDLGGEGAADDAREG
jgi:recombination protein RecT